MAIAIRYVDQWNVQQCLVRLEFLAKSMTGEEVARQLISTLSVTYGIESSFILTVRDGASVNQTPLLASFWISLFAHSPMSKMLWKNQTGKTVSSYSQTRWWSKWETLHQIMLQFGDIEPFLTANTDIGPSLTPKMLEILHSVPDLASVS